MRATATFASGTQTAAGQCRRRWTRRMLPVAAAFAVVATTALSGCSTDGKGTPAWTAQPDTGQASATGSPSGTGSQGSTATATPSPGSGGTPSPGATAVTWKTYSDPGKHVSFELPQDWIAQSVPADQGSLQGAIKVEVKDAAGHYLATLHTGLAASPAAPCAPDAAKPYVVVSSVPVDLPASSGENTIPPRVVFRVIQGYKFFGSYGITNMVGGADGHACQLRNVVQGPAGKGDYFFGDLASLRALAPDEKVAPAKSFDTLDQASKYVNEGSEFANVQRMLLSLKVNL